MNLAQLFQDIYSTHNHTRAQAEAQILQAREQNRSQFIHDCSTELANGANQDTVRQAAVLVIKNCIQTAPDGGEAAWLSIDHVTRESIKANILSALSTPNDPIRNAASRLIALIYPYEHNQNRWEDLIPIFSQNANHKDIEIKKSAIIALRELCEELTPNKITLSKDKVDQILTGICHGIQDKESVGIQINALSALTSGFKLVEEILKEKAPREIIENLIIKALSSDNITLKQKALMCIVEFVKNFYEHLTEWINPLWEITSKIIKSSEKDLAILAIEVWTAIAEQEANIKSESGSFGGFGEEKCLNIIKQAAPHLVPDLIQNLLDPEKYDDTTEDDESYEYEDLTVNSFSKTCLENIASAATFDEVFPLYFPNIQKFISSTNNVERRAGLILYSCALKNSAIEQSDISKSIPHLIPILMGYLKEDQKLSIREAAAIALARSVETFPQVFLDVDFAVVYSELLNSALQSNPRVSRHIAELWKHHAGFLIDEKERGSKINGGNLTLVIPVLIQNAIRELTDHYSLIDDSFAAAKFLLEFVGDDNDISEYLPRLLTQLNSCQDIEDDDRRKRIETGFSSCLQVVLRKHKFENADSYAEKVVQFAIQMLQTDSIVAGLGLVGALASSLGSTFVKIFDKFWPHVVEALQNSEKDMFDASTKCVSDLAKTCPEQFIGSLETVLDIYWESINKEGDCDKEAKWASVVTSVGKIVVGCQEHIAPYINRISKIYHFIIEFSLKMFDEGNFGCDEASETLREQTLDSYLEFFRVVTQTSNPEAIFDTLHLFIEYLAKTCKKEYNPTVDYIRTGLSFVVDIVTRFGEGAKEYVNKDFIQFMIKVLKNFTKLEGTQAVLDHALQVFKEAKFDF